MVHVYIGAWEGFGGGRAAVRGRKPGKVQVSLLMKKRAKLIFFCSCLLPWRSAVAGEEREGAEAGEKTAPEARGEAERGDRPLRERTECQVRIKEAKKNLLIYFIVVLFCVRNLFCYRIAF